MQYSTTINDESVFGITAARNAYNASLPATVEVEGEVVANPALIPNDSAYLDFILQKAITSWCIQFAPVVAPPPPPPTTVNGVPQAVTMRQAQLALLQNGLLSAVDSAISSIPGDAGIAARITWEKSSMVERNNALVATLAPMLNLTNEQIDQLFILAATL